MGQSVSSAGGTASTRPSSRSARTPGDHRRRPRRRARLGRDRPGGGRRLPARRLLQGPGEDRRPPSSRSTASATPCPATTPRSRPTARSPCSAGARCASTPAARRSSPRRSRRSLKTHPASRDAVAVGVPDEKFGEAITAVVELAPGAELDEPATHRPREGASWPPTRRPSGCSPIDTIGRAPNGKVDYKRLRGVCHRPLGASG